MAAAAAAEVRAAPPESDLFILSAFGRRFLKGPERSPRLGTVPAVEGAPHTSGDLDVRLLRGTIKHVDTRAKWSEEQAASYQDGLHLTTDAAANWTQAREGHDGDSYSQSQMAMAQLEEDEEGYYE